MRRSLALPGTVCLNAAIGVVLLLFLSPAAFPGESPPIASLEVEDAQGNVVPLPLEHTEVHAEVSGFVARVEVIQTYGNPFEEPIEATYVFPLPERAAVDDFLMEIGSRRVRGEIHRREEARQIYERARSSGYTASLLEQERPNIFVQSVANILPGDSIRIHIRYVDLLQYEEGAFRFLFPMVVGPRYFPGGKEISEAAPEPAPVPAGFAGHSLGAAVVPAVAPGPASRSGAYQPPDPPTDVVPGAKRINPPVLRPDHRSGHDISLTLDVETAVPIGSLVSDSHAIVIDSQGPRRARVSLAAGDRIPNKDFMLRIDVAQELPEVGVIAHRTGDDGFFALRLQPKAEIGVAEAAPKEILFVLDESGSMSGLPIEMSRKFMLRALETLGPEDHFNIIRFSTNAKALSPVPLPSDRRSVERGLQTIRKMTGGGGTNLLYGLQEALRQPRHPDRIRIIFFLSDGFIGNEQQIFDSIRQKAQGARVFTLGIGSSVNHYLLREMAALGGGAYQYIRPDGNEKEAVERFHNWVTLPYLTDLEIDWGGLAVEDMQPSRIPDLFSGQTLTLVGRYMWGGDETVIVRGRLGGRRWETQVPVHLPEQAESHGALASVWARHRIRDLLLEGSHRPEIEYQVTSLALSFRLMSPFTSFVAVDESEVVNPGGDPLQVKQALPLPEFVTFEGCFGADGPGAAHPDDPAPAAITPDDRGSVRVEIHDADGPARAARVLLFTTTQGSVTDLLTGDDGVARFDGLEPGPGYRLTALYRGAVFDSNLFDVQPGTQLDVPISTVAEPEPAPVVKPPRIAPAHGSSPSGTAMLIGQVVDKNGGPMPGVAITVRGPSTGMVAGTVTNAAGRYRLPALTPATDVIVVAELPGFAKVEVSPIHLNPDKTTTQNFSLVPSSETTTVIRVTQRGDLVDVASTKTATVFESEFVDGLPIVGRSYQDILAGAPGVAGDGAANVGMARSSRFATTVHGKKSPDPVTGTFGQNLDLESMAEIAILSSGAPAEFSQAQGGFANIVSRRSIGHHDKKSKARLATLIVPGATSVVEPALRVLADLASDRRLSHAEGFPALAGLVGAQDSAGRLGRSVTEHALATWALAEALRSYPELPWLAQARDAAVAALRAAAYDDGEWPAIRGAKSDPFTSNLASLALRTAGVEPVGTTPADLPDVSAGLADLAGESGARLAERLLDGLNDGHLGPQSGTMS